MSNIIPFGDGARLPAYLKQRDQLAAINNDVVTAAAYPTLSIKGKVFTIKRDGERKVLMNPRDPESVAQYIETALIRINMHNRVFYAARFDEANSEGAVPDCYSLDGKAPAAGAPNKQCTSCGACPHAVWGSRVKEDGSSDGKGRACSDQPRIAIAAPDALDQPMLLRVPPASISNLKDAIKLAKQRNIPYNALVYRVSFDTQAASPKLMFKPVGLLDDEGYAKVQSEYDGDMVRAIVGLDDVSQAAPAPAPVQVGGVSSDELDAALAARAVTQKAATAAKARPPAPPAATVTEDELAAIVPPPVAAPAPKAPPAPAPAPVAPAAAPDDDLLSGLDALLGLKDD